MSKPTLTICPKSCLQDEKIVIKVTGLVPGSPYTLSSHLQDSRKNKYFSYAHYYANNIGNINSSEHESYGGSYKGIFQMGLIAGLQPTPDEYQYLRLFKRDVEKPNEIEFRVYENFKTPEEIFSFDSSFLVNELHYRYFMGPAVERIPVRTGRVRATLFIPPGEGPFPGVVDMFGTAGGLLEYRSAQLASRGIASLALAFFDYEDLPQTLDEFDLEYFKEAVNVLLNHSKVKKPYVGTIGTSKGGDLALTMATFIPEVKCAVSINGCCSNFGSPMKITDVYIIPFLGLDIGKTKIYDNNMVSNYDCTNNPEDYPETIIPIHKSDAKFLFIVGLDDRNMPTDRYAEISAGYLRNANKGNNYKICSYEGTGHLIEPPYSPLCFSSYHKVYGFVFVWGGSLKEHTKAQEESWIEMINFIKGNLDSISSKL